MLINIKYAVLIFSFCLVARNSNALDTVRTIQQPSSIDASKASDDSSFYFILHHHIYFGLSDKVKALITPDNSKIIGENDLLHVAVEREKEEVVKFLLSLQVNPNALDLQGETPLCKAARRGNIKIAQMLKDAGAIDAGATAYFREPNSNWFCTKEPLLCAIEGNPAITVQKHIECIRWFVEQGGRIAHDEYQARPVVYCAHPKKITKLLQQLNTGDNNLKELTLNPFPKTIDSGK